MLDPAVARPESTIPRLPEFRRGTIRDCKQAPLTFAWLSSGTSPTPAELKRKARCKRALFGKLHPGLGGNTCRSAEVDILGPLVPEPLRAPCRFRSPDKP